MGFNNCCCDCRRVRLIKSYWLVYKRKAYNIFVRSFNAQCRLQMRNFDFQKESIAMKMFDDAIDSAYAAKDRQQLLIAQNVIQLAIKENLVPELGLLKIKDLQIDELLKDVS